MNSQKTKGSRKTALLFTAHKWQSRAQGGFHKFAEALCKAGLDVDFVSSPLSCAAFLFFKEHCNIIVFLRLLFGKHYRVCDRTLFNFTCPAIGIGPLRQLFPATWTAKLGGIIFPSLIRRIRKRGHDYAIIIFESATCVVFYPEIRDLFKSAIIVYRPSDPLSHNGKNDILREAELLLLKEADVVLLVNEESRDLFARTYPHIDVASSRFHILPNGVDIAMFQRTWKKPKEFRDRPVAVYVGLFDVSWDLILYCAENAPDIDFVIVRPTRPDKRYRHKIQSQENLFHIPGVLPHEVPRYVTNADVIILPYIKSSLLHVARLHSKLLQAMVAHKPIVTIELSHDLEKYGIMVANDRKDFLHKLRDSLAMGPITYPVDLEALDWMRVQTNFLSLIGF